MEILYVLVLISLGVSFGFLALFFWAVDRDQMTSLDQKSFLIFEDNHEKGSQDE